MVANGTNGKITNVAIGRTPHVAIVMDYIKMSCTNDKEIFCIKTIQFIIPVGNTFLKNNITL